MTAPFLSVVVPALNEAERIERTLVRALHGSGLPEVEVLVVDGGSTDGTPDLAARHTRVLTGPLGRARQMNVGARAARGQVVLFCHADTLLPQGYGLAVQRALADPGVVGGAFSPSFDARHPLLALMTWGLSLPTTRLMFGDQALFARRTALEAVGYYPEIPLMEEVRLVQSLRRLGRMVRLPERVVTSARRFQERGVWRQTLLDLALYGAYLLGADPARLARRYAVTRRDPPPWRPSP